MQPFTITRQPCVTSHVQPCDRAKSHQQLHILFPLPASEASTQPLTYSRNGEEEMMAHRNVAWKRAASHGAFWIKQAGIFMLANMLGFSIKLYHSGFSFSPFMKKIFPICFRYTEWFVRQRIGPLAVWIHLEWLAGKRPVGQLTSCSVFHLGQTDIWIL